MIQGLSKYRGVYLLVIVGLVLVILASPPPLSCRKAKMTKQSDTTYLLRVDTIKIQSVVYQPLPVNVIYRDTIELPAIIDTAAILRDYYAKRYYSDTISDSAFKIVLMDTISENRIVSRKWVGEAYPKTITTTITNEVEYLRGELWLQGVLGQSYGMGAIYKRNDWGFGAIYSIKDSKGSLSGQLILRIK